MSLRGVHRRRKKECADSVEGLRNQIEGNEKTQETNEIDERLTSGKYIFQLVWGDDSDGPVSRL